MPISTAAQVAVATAIPSARLGPPSDLTEEQAADWRLIVAKFPPDQFGSDNAPILREFCRHLSYARQIAEALAGMRRRVLTTDTPKVAKQRAIFDQLLKMHAAQSACIVSLATKLRLTPQSYRNARFDERKARTMPDGPRPWEGWGDDRAGQN